MERLAAALLALVFLAVKILALELDLVRAALPLLVTVSTLELPRMALLVLPPTAAEMEVLPFPSMTTRNSRERDLEYQAREQALEKSLAKEEARAAELEEYRVYVQTKQYIEKVAKEKLGLVNKDEILFKADESS